jgi:hypothetical protein
VPYRGIKRTNAKVDSELLDFVFKLAHPQANKSVYDGFRTVKGDYELVSLAAVHRRSIKKEMDKKEYHAFNAQLSRAYGQEDVQAFMGQVTRAAVIS